MPSSLALVQSNCIARPASQSAAVPKERLWRVTRHSCKELVFIDSDNRMARLKWDEKSECHFHWRFALVPESSGTEQHCRRCAGRSQRPGALRAEALPGMPGRSLQSFVLVQL